MPVPTCLPRALDALRHSDAAPVPAPVGAPALESGLQESFVHLLDHLTRSAVQLEMRLRDLTGETEQTREHLQTACRGTAMAAKSAMETARLAKGFVTAQTQSAPPGNERPGTPSSDALSLRGLLLELEALEASVARRKMRENATIEQQVPETAASFAATIEHLYAVADNIAATLAKDELAQTDMRVKRGAV